MDKLFCAEKLLLISACGLTLLSTVAYFCGLATLVAACCLGAVVAFMLSTAFFVVLEGFALYERWSDV